MLPEDTNLLSQRQRTLLQRTLLFIRVEMAVWTSCFLLLLWPLKSQKVNVDSPRVEAELSGTGPQLRPPTYEAQSYKGVGGGNPPYSSLLVREGKSVIFSTLDSKQICPLPRKTIIVVLSGFLYKYICIGERVQKRSCQCLYSETCKNARNSWRIVS